MTQADPQMAFQMHFQKLMQNIFSQTNSCIQEVNNYMYQLQMNLLMQTSQMPQQQQCSYMPMAQMPQMAHQQSCSYMPMQMPFQMAPQMPTQMAQIMPSMMPQQWHQPQQQQCTYMPMPVPMPQMTLPQQQQWQQPQAQMSQTIAPAITPVVIQPPTPPPSVPKPTAAAPKVTITPPPPPPADEAPIVKLRAKPKPKDGQLTPPSPITSNRNSLIDELRNSGGRKSLRKVTRKDSVPKKEESLPAWARSRDREKRSSFNPPADFETLEAFLFSTKDHQKSMPNLRSLSRANSDERKSPPPISPLAISKSSRKGSSSSATSLTAFSPTDEKVDNSSCATLDEKIAQKPKPPKNTNVAAAIKAAIEASKNPSPESSHSSSTELIPRGDEDVEEALEVDYDPHPSTSLIIAIPTSRALVPHRQLNPEYPEAPHGWQLLMWTIRKVGKFLKKHDLEHGSKKDGWELVHHRH